MASVLVIAAHPDDEVLGCGGVMARHADAGDDVHVVVVTRGVKDLFAEESIELLRSELEDAHAVLGVRDVRFLDFPAPKLDTVPLYSIANAIGQAIRDLRPCIVYCPYQGDLHADHKAVFWATLVAGRPVNEHRISRILCYETLSETDWAAPLPSDRFSPDVFVDISATVVRKLRALRCYRSQVRPFPHPRSLRAISALSRVRGSTAGVFAAEAFVLVREVIL